MGMVRASRWHWAISIAVASRRLQVPPGRPSMSIPASISHMLLSASLVNAGMLDQARMSAADVLQLQPFATANNKNGAWRI